jgi:Mg2+/Co2+ transporter CorC
MLQKVIVGVVLFISLSFNVHITVRDYLIQKEKEFYSEYIDYTVVSDRNGQIMGLLQLQAVAEPVVGDTIVAFTNEKELFLTVTEANAYENLATAEE